VDPDQPPRRGRPRDDRDGADGWYRGYDEDGPDTRPVRSGRDRTRRYDEEPTRRLDRDRDYDPTYDERTREQDERIRTQAPGARVPKKMTVTRVAAARTRYLLGQGTRRINAASRADGADESGLTRLIWMHAAHYTADAMITVCLAGTIFFSAARSEQRLQVALYLLVTMAPFALVAPFIGPALDRLHRGRRMALAATGIGRAVLAWIMAAQFDNGFALYPAAFGALVLSKAYAVLRGACLPRVLPPGLSLVSANARMSMFGLGAAAAGGAVLAGIINVTDSYPLALRITAVVCVGAAVLSLRLPATVDSAEGEEQVPATVVGAGRGRVQMGGQVVTALRAAGALRGLSGFLTLFLAFWIQSTKTGTTAAVGLGGLVGAAALGAVAGTALGARMPMRHPDPVLLGSIGGVAAISVVAALSFGLGTALLVVAAAGVANALGKLCLDAIIQREVPEGQRASAFARSETLLQLAWVAGGGLGIALPSNGTLGFAVAAALLVGAFALTVVGRRRPLRRARPAT
jgi:MFS family permease